MQGWGYHPSDGAAGQFRTVLVQAMLLNRSPLLEDLTTKALLCLRDDPALGRRSRGHLYGIHRAVASLGHADPPPKPIHAAMPELEGVPAPWADWVERWYATSTLTPKVRGAFRSIVSKAGRWLAAEHPSIVEPAQWTRQTCAAWVAALDRMVVGDYVQRRVGLDTHGGKPLSARTKAGYLTATRTFFRDVQEWGWIPRRFGPITGDSREVLARDAVCLLDVPVHKTGTAFTKPVDPLLGQAIEA